MPAVLDEALVHGDQEAGGSPPRGPCHILHRLVFDAVIVGEELGQEGDWIWVCLTVLWERWFPDQPSFEMLDEKMQRGYKLLAANDEAGAAHSWLDTWRDVLVLADRLNLRTVEDFDERFGGTQSVFNWVQDMPDTLWNVGLGNEELLRKRITFCETFLRQFAVDSNLTVENMRRSIAETYVALGDTDKADALFQQWLEADPQWGWGWIGWADCYWTSYVGRKDAEAAERILRRGLAVREVRDRHDLLERLGDLRCDTEAEPVSGAVRHSIEVSPSGRAAKLRTSVCFGETGLPLEQLSGALDTLRASHRVSRGDAADQGPTRPLHSENGKIGRNAPCPCGSGKKYKKCCGRT